MPLTDARTIYLSHVNFDRKVLVVLDTLFIFVCVVNHVFVNIKNPASINEEGVEPKVEGTLLPVVKLYPHVVVH